MSSEVSTRIQLSTDQRMQVLAYAARGDSNQAIIDEIKREHGVEPSQSAISQLRSRHADTIKVMRDKMLEQHAQDASAIADRARRMIYKQLDKAERDMTDLERLDMDYREGKIDDDQYARKKKGLMTISIAQLRDLSKEMHQQTAPPGGTDSVRQPALGQGDPGATEALLKAIQSSDAVTLQQLIFKPKSNDNAQ